MSEDEREQWADPVYDADDEPDENDGETEELRAEYYRDQLRTR